MRLPLRPHGESQTRLLCSTHVSRPPLLLHRITVAGLFLIASAVQMATHRGLTYRYPTGITSRSHKTARVTHVHPSDGASGPTSRVATRPRSCGVAVFLRLPPQHVRASACTSTPATRATRSFCSHRYERLQVPSRIACALHPPRKYIHTSTSTTTVPLTHSMGKGFVVRVFLYECSDLLASDSELQGGKSDPYVVFSIGGKTHKSSRKNNNLNPKWSPPERFEFKIQDWENEFMVVNVYDHDLIGSDDLIGSAIIPLALYAGGRHEDLYRYPLVLPDEIGAHGPRSDVHLQITLTTTDGQPVQYYY